MGKPDQAAYSEGVKTVITARQEHYQASSRTDDKTYSNSDLKSPSNLELEMKDEGERNLQEYLYDPNKASNLAEAEELAGGMQDHLTDDMHDMTDDNRFQLN